jgi:dolichol-phosphate mannosyltransferase
MVRANAYLEVEEMAMLSVIVPLYNEEAVIVEMHSRLIQALEKFDFDFEILLVNDGSRDRTMTLARDLCAHDDRVKLVSFSRNFGHQIAVTAGLDKASGQAVAVIDADLQDPPEVIGEMFEKWRSGYQVVYGVRQTRKGEMLFKRATAALFYRLLRKMTPVDVPVDTGDFRLMDRRVVDELARMRERNRFVRGMVSWIGFRQCEVSYVREERFAGETKYPLAKMLKFALDGIFSFSDLPLKVSSLFGFICAATSLSFMAYGFVIKYVHPEGLVPGWTSLFVAILFVGGVQLICLGILGEYLGRIYEEVKGRPLYVIDEEINF